MKKILVTGGCGYVGTVLVNKLIENNYFVDVIDTQWFGNKLEDNPKLKIYKNDIRDIDSIDFSHIDTVFHLANIANDPGVELNPTLSWEVNVIAGISLIEKCIENKVSEFIFASSGSVYGVKEEENVTEDLKLLPISTYNKTKMAAERVFLSYSDRINIKIIRPATVCGLSPRMRFDVSVNMFALQAFTNKNMTVLGGKQVRPNIHVEDLVNIYLFFLKEKFNFSDIFNAGFENISIMDIAKLVKKHCNSNIEIKKSNDPRSYRQNSNKLINLGFSPSKNVEIAVEEIINALKKGNIKDHPSCHTVKWMKELNLS